MLNDVPNIVSRVLVVRSRDSGNTKRTAGGIFVIEIIVRRGSAASSDSKSMAHL